MSEDNIYKDGDIVWVRLGNNWWPGEVTGPTRHPEGLINHLKRAPYCVVKFFNENTYEYVRNNKQIFPFQCAKQEEFIRKGYSLYNSGNSFMEKFPSDVEVAKKLIRRKESSLLINDRPNSIVKAILGQPLIRTNEECYDGSEYREKRRSSDSITKILNITQNRNNDVLKLKSQVSANALNLPNYKTKNTSSSPANNGSNYQCNFCDFSSVRLNVMILHRKMHSNRNSVGANNLVSTKSLNALSEPIVAPVTATKSNANVVRNEMQQKQILNKNKKNSKTKVSTISTDATKLPESEPPSRVKESASLIAPVESDTISLTLKAKNNRTIKLQTPTDTSKIAKKTAIKEKKQETPYDTILSDFCCLEEGASPPSEEQQSRRSMRYCRTNTENSASKLSTVCIDLSETKAIQKIPKKREYSLLRMQEISKPVAVEDPDVVYLPDKEKESTSEHSVANKRDAEDIRRMLLADWSDEDETLNDANLLDVSENSKNNVCISALVNETHNSSAVVVTSTPVTKSSSSSIGRIRNIPKKDRRDVVLQDFNNDLSFGDTDDSNRDAKTVAVELDSSNSSIIEIIEDQALAAIITINDDEDPESSRSSRNQADVNGAEAKDIDSVGLINDKTVSGSTSTSTLSCFDFQDDEDDPDNSSITIPHFKKKYLSGDKLQALSTTTTDELIEDNMDKNRSELAEKDKRLAAEIETLLEQTQPTSADLINSNSFEESISVKDLPIKERGKRIFKSRNKIRTGENKTNIEHVTTRTGDISLSIGAQIEEMEQSNLNVNTGTESFDNEKDRSNAEVVITKEKEVELLPNEESLINKKCLDEISSREVFFCPQSDIPKLLDNEQLPKNEDKENMDLMERNKNCLDESISDEKTNENQLETANTFVENSIENISKGQTESDPKMNDKIELSQQISKDKEDVIQQQEPVLAKTDQMSKTEAKVDIEVAENIEVNNESCLVVEPSPNVVQNIVGNSSLAGSSAEPSDVRNIEKKDMSASKVKVLQIEILGHRQKNFDSDAVRECEMDTDVVKSPNQLTNACKDLKTFAPTEICDDDVKNEMFRRSLDKGLFIINPEKNDDIHKKENQNQSSETAFKIRVKSPEELLNHALVMTSQQEQELPRAVDSNVDIRLSVTTPTDENSSMGASDTGAEFGSPTSMLSEERLPTFRFQNNQTPQHEIERCETQLKPDNVTKITEEGINKNDDEIDNSGKIGGNLQKLELHIIKDGHRKCLRQQRFSMDFKCFETEAKSFKRQRMSVDSITSADENNFKKCQENSLKIFQHKNEESTRPKNRHMKITPRRNVSELFKTNKSFRNHSEKVLQKNNSVDIVEESLSTDEFISHTENKPSENGQTIVSIPENSSVVSNEVFEERTEKVQSSESIKNKELEHLNNEEQATLTSDDKEDNVIKDELITHTKPAEDKEDSNALEAERKILHPPTKEITVDISNNNDNTSNKSVGIEGNSDFHPIATMSTDEDVVRHLNFSENVNTNPSEVPLTTMNRDEDVGENILLSVDNRKTHNNHVLEAPYSPGPPPPSPQEREIVIESENVNQALSKQQEIQSEIEIESGVAVIPLTLKERKHPKEISNELLVPKERKRHLSEEDKKLEIPKRNEPLKEDVVSTLTSAVLETVGDTNAINVNVMSETGTLVESSMVPCPLDVIEFGSTAVESNLPKESGINSKYENELLNPKSPQAKDLIIECEPSTPQGIIECDDNVLAKVTPEKEVIIESDLINATSAQEKDIIIEENLQLEEKENLLEREFPVIEPKEKSSTVDIIQQLQLNSLETDADKAAEEFLIEFDSIVNHSHTAEEDISKSAIEDAINAEDLINNIIEEVHEDHQLKHDKSTKSKSPVPYEPVATYKVVAHKNSWNQIFKDSLSKQLRSTKRRQTICFEISEKKEGVTGRKQAVDFESILPTNKTKRTAERKLTLPATETKLSNTPQSQNIYALNNNQLTLNKKFIPATKRKLSIEDNITPFIIERPKPQHQPCNTTAGPPPLQRIIPVNRQAHIIPKPSPDSLSETTPLQTNDSLFHELFPSESTSNAQPVDTTQRSEYGLVTHQQIISSPTISSISQNKMADAKISANKQIGVDSRGNKYVIIKTPPTDIVVQPTITSSTAAAVAGTSNFGTTITIQPISRSATDLGATSTATINKNLPSAVATSSCKQQVPQQQQVKHISIAVQPKPSLEISNSSEISAKTQSRNRRKTAQAKAIASATAANSNLNSAKHRQAMEALTRRLSIASEAPPLAKMPRTSSTRVQTQISNNSNLTTFFADSNIPNIAQQQLIQLQQQHTQTTSPSLPPPIILNKNAHQQSLTHRKPRRIPQHVQQQHQTQIQRQQQIATTKLQQLQQQHQQSQPVHQPQHVITQIALQQQPQQHNSLQPPPLQQIQTPSLQTQQQIVQQADGIIITTPVADDDNVIDSNTQLIALPTQPYPGYSETFLLCKVKGNTCKPVDNVPLYLNKQLNELVPVPLEAIGGGHKSLEQQIEIKASNAHEQQLIAGQKNEQNERQQDNDGNLQIANINCNLLEGEMTAGIETEHQMQQQQIMEECVEESCVNGNRNQINEFATNQEVNTELVSNNGILLNIEGQQVLLDATTFAHLLANPDANTQLISDDGTEYVLTHEVLQALQMQQEQQQVLELTNVAPEQQHHTLEQPRGTDIIAVALAGSDLYDSDVLTIDTSQGVQLIGGDGTIVFPSQTGAIAQQHLTPPAVVTNAVLDQSPIMSTLEVPSSIATAHKLQGSQLITVPSHQLATSSNAALGMGGRSNLEDSLAAIGVTTQTSSIHSSLGLPITVTNPNIASKVTSVGPLNEMLQFVSHRPPTAAAAANAVAAAALAGESRIFTD